jgi:2-polyprenyl-3-methyl-5-hydroxy-6-metoxy-1,4-benzoquinol methylase
MAQTATDPSSLTADDVAQRVFNSALGTVETLSIYVGDRMGWYRALVEGGPATYLELAERAGGHPRYIKEWLEQQAAYGLLDVSGDNGERRFSLAPATAEVLTDEHSLSYLAPLARMLAASAIQLPSLMNAYEQGGGVGWSQFGDDARQSQGDMNRPWFERVLPEALAGVDSVHSVLSRPNARVADIGFGAGWSSIAIARAYEDATVDGFDVDEPSVEMAARNAKESGLEDRVRFYAKNAGEMEAEGYDAVFAFECIHDMPYPIEVLAAARRAIKDGGVVIVMDEAVGDRFTAPADEVERLMYGFSLFLCLPDGMAHENSAATGTVMRPETLERYSREAGFSRLSVLPIEDFGFWRFYQLHQ